MTSDQRAATPYYYYYYYLDYYYYTPLTSISVSLSRFIDFFVSFCACYDHFGLEGVIWWAEGTVACRSSGPIGQSGD